MIKCNVIDIAVHCCLIFVYTILNCNSYLVVLALHQTKHCIFSFIGWHWCCSRQHKRYAHLYSNFKMFNLCNTLLHWQWQQFTLIQVLLYTLYQIYRELKSVVRRKQLIQLTERHQSTKCVLLLFASDFYILQLKVHSRKPFFAFTSLSFIALYRPSVQ